MIDPNISDEEKTCVRILAKLFSKGADIDPPFRATLAREGLVLDYPAYCTVMSMMEQYGAIDEATHVFGDDGQFSFFRITPKALQIVRELDQQASASQKPGDIVGQINETARAHPVVAYIIIAVVSLTAIVTLINQFLDLLSKFGVPLHR